MMDRIRWHCFIDDERYPKNITWVNLPLVNWTIIRNYDEFINAVKTRGVPAIVSWDHDLGEEHYGIDWTKKDINTTEKTGADCARWLANYCIDKGERFPEYYVHSMNPVGAANIRSIIHSAMESIGDAVRTKEVAKAKF